ncbi:ATP-binding cassette domain-containing protein [Nakamurella sp. YIM 132087]|uniref:Glutathione import ATP-binding protein GsiA n=1 Tax=Nakamurella alba TaxID=2665158 RepID=A0A7K1FG00_9ACTN|nr:ATP-binding cassette domain-containing protein [Nakamurella alba]
MVQITGLSVDYSRGFGRGSFRAVDDVSLTIARRETLSVVGESGSGKTTIGSALLGLQRPSSGSIVFDGQDITHRRPKDRRLLSTKLQAVFQDPFSSLDPSAPIMDSVREPLTVAGVRSTRRDTDARILDMLERVGIRRTSAHRYPGEFSGGQRQRIAIARALILDPDLVVCDEAVSALDVSVQAQVLNLLEDLQRETGTSYLFISHNIGVVRHISDRVIVLYRGRVMETGTVSEVCDRPAHPYTRALLASVPVPDVHEQKARREARALTSTRTAFAPRGGIGCPFAPRCPYAQSRCIDETPPLTMQADGRSIACVRAGEIPLVETAIASKSP